MKDIRVVTEFPRRVREIENIWIPMPDGVKLAARIWLPEDAEADPVPAILEYLPYRKRDGTVERDALTHPYFAGHGYAGVRVDMRGSGDSEGLCKGEYLLQEQDDALAVIDWLAAQPWCSGAVGMIGISWGGFNGLQVAARRPPALKAIVTLCSTDDRYTDDVHYLGGAQMIDNLHWGTTAWAIAMTPPDPAIVGPRWREMWEARLNGNGIWMQDWFAHQRRDDFYRHGSVCESYGDIQAAVYAVGGWVDGYTNPIFRLLEGLSCPRKGLVGPWAHKYPHFALPGPRIGFLQECLRWWDRYLKNIDNGIDREPMLRAWMQDPIAPAPYHDEIPGRWVAEEGWAGDGVGTVEFGLSPGQLVTGAGSGVLSITSPQTAGMASGNWCPYGVVPTGALDQRLEAGGALIFETAPLAADLEILGFPVFEVTLASDKPVALLSATLSAVATDGAATRISYGILNLTHRDDHLDLKPMQPGVAETVRLRLKVCGQRFAKGQKIRLAVASAHFPIVFPAPEAATLTLHCAESRLILPAREPKPLDATLAPFAGPESAAPWPQEQLVPAAPFERSLLHDHVTDEVSVRNASDTGRLRHLHTGMIISQQDSNCFAVRPGDPNSAVAICTWDKLYERDTGWKVTLSVKATLRALRDVWRMETEIVAKDGNEVVKQETGIRDFPRDLN